MAKSIALVGARMLFLVSAASLGAHPHLFIDARVAFEFDGSTLDAIEIEWHFDEMFSSMVRSDYDSNRNGRFDPSEVERVRDGAFSNLQHFDYFTYLVIDGTRHAVSEVRDFRVSTENDRLTYRFRVPVPDRPRSPNRTVQVLLYDETYFTDIALSERYGTVRGQRSISYELSRAQLAAYSYSYGSIAIVPEAVQLRYATTE